MVREIPKTSSPSSATRKDMGVPDYGMDADRVTPNSAKSGITQGLKVTQEVKYAEYENDKRETEDFGVASGNKNQTQGFDGTKSIEPVPFPKDKRVTTEFS